jgi:hypothetical protein
MDEKRIPVSFRVSPRFKRCLELGAEREKRSLTNFIEKLVFDYCSQHDLDPDSPRSKTMVQVNKKDSS